MKKIEVQDLEISLASILRESGYRATPGKLELLSILKQATRPLTSSEILFKLKDKKDETTVYRSLDALVDSGLVRKIQFNDRSARYEWNVDRPHHHHIVCENCGRIEDIDICDTDLDAAVLAQSKQFSAIKSHSAEFFGVCYECGKK